MDWEQAANSENAERLEDGFHRVKVAAVHRKNKDGQELETAKGPYLSVVFHAASGGQAKQSFWLTEKAGWRLARALKAMGMNLQKMTAAGIELGHFLDDAFCQKQLVGRECWIEVTHNGDYANADVVDAADVPATAKTPHAPKPADDMATQFEDDIPF